MSKSFWGYRRENGRVGVRNHVIILPLDDLSNAASEAVANNIKGSLAIPHPYGRLQFGADLDLHFRTLIGTGANPNVAAVVVIGIEPGWTKRVVDGIAKTGKPVNGFAIEGHGDIATIAAASYQAKDYVHWASEKSREEAPLKDLWVSVKCGESDTTSGLAANPTVGNVIGNPIEPVVKLSANPRTVRTMGEHIDLDVSGILRRELTLDAAGDALIDIALRTANGRLTAAEVLGHREFVLTKLYRSA